MPGSVKCAKAYFGLVSVRREAFILHDCAFERRDVGRFPSQRVQALEAVEQRQLDVILQLLPSLLFVLACLL